MAAIKAMQDKKLNAKVADKVTFAGQSYQLERAKTNQDVKKQQTVAKNKLGGSCEGLDALVTMIGDKDKNVTTMTKTKIDWDKHTKEQGLETELEKNRKDGYLAKKKFLDGVSELEY